MSMIRGQMMPYALTLTNILKHAQKHAPSRGVITKTPAGTMHRYSYGDFYKRTCRLAHALKKLGVKEGDRIATFAWNTYQHLELYYAIPCIGAICHTLNIRLSDTQLAYIINHAEDRIVFVDATLVPLIERIKPQLRDAPQFVIINAPANFQSTLGKVLQYEDLLAPESDDYAWPEIDENSAATLCYTSGTTGNPKGALYSHRSQFLHAMMILTGDVVGLRATDSALTVVPMFHVNAWGLPFAAVMSGTDLIFPGPHMKPTDLASLISECKVTVAAGVPTLWMGLFGELKKGGYNTSSLRSLVVGGAAMPRSLIEGFEKELKIPVFHAWGMTETSPVGTTVGLLENEPNLTAEQRYDLKAKQGRPVPCIDIRIVAEDGKVVPWDGKTMGELHVKGPTVIASYYKDPSGDSQFTKDGWFITGDVATISSEGVMTITDRSKDLIKSGGEWISSVALENALVGHPAVQEAAVVAVTHEKWSERPIAVVVPRPGEDASIAALQAHLGKSFSRLEIPEDFLFVKEIPKTSVGKLDKKQIRAMISDGSIKNVQI